MVKNKIKILYLLDTYKTPNAGTERQIKYLIENIDKNNFDIEFALFRFNEKIEEIQGNYKTHNLDIKNISKITSILKILYFASYCRVRKFKIVHIYFNDASILAPFAFWLFGIKVIISRRDMGFWYNEKNLGYLKRNSPFIDKVIVNCDAVKKIVADMEKINKFKIEVIYNGYMFMENSSCDMDFNNIIKDRFLIGIVCNLRPIKRVDLLINAFNKLQKNYEKLLLVIIGGGDTEKYKQIVEELGISKYVIFLGSKSNIGNYLNKFNVGVICSESEGLSNTIIEYMMHDVPVICTNVGGNSELVIDGKTGLLTKAGDVDDLYEKLEYMYRNYNSFEKMKDKAKQHVSDMCDMNKMIKQHENIYLNLVKY